MDELKQTTFYTVTHDFATRGFRSFDVAMKQRDTSYIICEMKGIWYDFYKKSHEDMEIQILDIHGSPYTLKEADWSINEIRTIVPPEWQYPRLLPVANFIDPKGATIVIQGKVKGYLGIIDLHKKLKNLSSYESWEAAINILLDKTND